MFVSHQYKLVKLYYISFFLYIYSIVLTWFLDEYIFLILILNHDIFEREFEENQRFLNIAK